jgi:carbonic anhydrase
MVEATSSSYTAEKALARLKEGNERFVRGEARFPTVQKELLAALAKAQHPYATILGCSDSRVPPELIFDAGFGELFIVRVAGNVVSPEVLGSLQYAAFHLQTPLFLVLGHEGCGAVGAALAAVRGDDQQPARIARLLENITPGVREVPAGLDAKAAIRAGVDANVRWAMRQLLEIPEIKARRISMRAILAGAVYQLETGRVRILDCVTLEPAEATV